MSSDISGAVPTVDPTRISALTDALREADADLRTAVAHLDPDLVGGPSRLPDWSVGHVLSHLARNADGLRNLLHWARTGEQTPMYASAEARDADVESGARRPAEEILDDFVVSSDRFLAAADDLPPAAWSALVRTRSGGPIPAMLVLDHRLCEVELHHHDLGIDDGLTILSERRGLRLLDSLQRTYVRTHEVPPLVLDANTGDRIEIGETPDPAGGDRTVVSGSAAALAGWLSGRTGGDELIFDGPRPSLPSW